MTVKGTAWQYLRGADAPPHGAELVHERRKKAAWLRKKGGTQEADHLATSLEACKPLTRCRSGACPVCVGQTQIRLAEALARQVASAPGIPFVATIVPISSAVPIGQLREIDHFNQVRRLKRALVGLPFEWMAGGFDFSLNEHKENRYQPHWLPHIFVIGVTEDVPGLRLRMRHRFPSSDPVPRPVKLTAWDGRWNALFYALKVSAYRRVGVDDGSRFDPKSGEIKACRDIEQQRLRSAERLELSLYLNELGITRRLFAAGAQLHHRGRRTEIRPLNSW